MASYSRAVGADASALPGGGAVGTTISVRHRCLLVLAVAVALFVLPSTAAAHTVLVRADPASGAVLAESPGLARLWFSDDMAPARSTARLVDERGASVPGTQLVAGSGDPRVIAVVLPTLASGSYGLLWEAVSAKDGHTTNGTVLFAIGKPGTLLVAGSSTGSGELVRRWAGLVALAGLAGSLAVGLIVVRRQDLPILAAARRRLLNAALLSGIIALGIEFAGPADVGGLRTAHLVTLALLCGMIALLRRQRPVTAGVAALLVVLLWIEALGSHAAALPSGRFFALLAGAVHAFAGLLWLGAVPALLVVLWPRGRSRADLAQLVRICRGPFSILAGGSMVLVVVSGLYGAGLEVATPRGLVASPYGRLLLLKVLLLAAMGVLGLVNAQRLRRRSLPARTIVVEVGVGLVLLVAVSALVSQPPPLGGSPVASSDAAPGFSSADGPADRTVLTRSGSVDDLVVTVSATPNQPGMNWFTVLADSSRRPAPAPIDGVDLRIGPATAERIVTLQRLTATRYFATYQTEAAGPLQVVAVLHRGGRQYAVRLDWRVSPAASPVAAGPRLAPYVDVAALLVLEAAVAACAWWLVHTGRRRAVVPVRAVADRGRGGSG
jgi:copper transport protein